MKKFCLFIWFVMFPLFLWGQGLNDGTFDPSNPRDPQSVQLDAGFSWDVLCNRAQFKANSSYKKNIRYEWTLDGDTIGSDAMAVASFLSVGPHQICLKETYAGVTATKEQTFTVEPQANWYLWGDFTYDPSGLGIRNFTTANEAFTMLSEIPISSSISLEFKQACDMADYLQEHADLFDQLIAHANPDEWYHHEVRFTGNSLKLSNQLEPTLLKNYLKWAKQIRFDCLVLMGSYGFNDSTTPFQQQSLVSGNETTVRDFTQFSTQLNYRWQLTGTPQTTGWQTSGTGSLPSMLIESETFQPDTVVYRIEMMPAGTSEAYAVNEVTYLIYPKRIEHVDFRPAENQVIHDFSSVTFSWQEEWWTQDQTIQKYTFELWEEDKESVKYSRQYYTSNRYVTLNAVDFKFELNKHYCWRIIVHGTAGDMYSDIHHCNTCDMPDLQLSDWTWNIEEVTAGQELTITAKVTNVGTVASEAGQWSDRLYFSWEPVWEENAGTLLMTFPVEGVLEPGAFYQIEKKFTMPVLDKEGVGYFHLVAHSSTLELNMENNRLTSQPVTYRKVEDLRVDDVLIAKNKLIPGESVDFTAKVTNAGTRATTVESWTDKLYVSLDPEFSEETAILLRTYPHEGALPFQDFYTVDETFNMPLLEQEGTYYYYYVADVESAVVSDVDRSNNRRKGETTFSYQHVPDLQIANLSVSKQSIKPGESVQIGATVTNVGSKATPEVVWQTRLYLSDQPELDTQKARLLTTQEHTGPLAAQASYPVEYTFTLPRLIPGNYYFHWVVDPEKAVTGDPDRTNNQIVSEPVELLALPLDPVTDLIPTNQSTVGSPNVTFSWGNLADVHHFDLYIWKRGETQPEQPSFSNIQAIQYTARNYCLYDTSYEWRVVGYNGYGTKIGESDVLTFHVKALPDLHVTDLKCGEAWAGQTLDLSWTVQNDGKEETGNVGWADRVWLTPDITGTLTGYQLQKANVKALANGESYTNSAQIKIGERISGDYYVVVAADMDRVSSIDWSPAGGTIPEVYAPSLEGSPYPYLSAYYSTKKLEEPGNASLKADNFFYKKIRIQVPDLPDLQVLSVHAPSNSIAGQKVTVVAVIANKGEADVPTGKQWYDQISICPSEIYDRSQAVTLGQIVHKGGLAKGDQYSVTFEVTVPKNCSGNYYFFVRTDRDDVVYEHALSENNQTSSDTPIQISSIPLGDLEALSVEVPEKVNGAEPFEVKGTVRNSGLATIEDYFWTDWVYASTNPDGLDEHAVSLGALRHVGTLARGAEYTIQGKVNVEGLSAGDYYIYLVVNQTGNAAEALASNNTIRSEKKVRVEPTDLAVIALAVPDYLNKGTIYPFSWTIQNKGNRIENRTIRDVVRILDDAGNEIDQLSATYSLTLESGASYTHTLNHYIKSWPQKEIYQVVVETNVDHSLAESGWDNNRSEPKSVNYTSYQTDETGTPVTGESGEPVVLPLKDLALQAHLPNNDLTTSEPFQLEWQVRNAGEAVCPKWEVRIYIVDAVKRLLATESGRDLAVGANQSGVATLAIPDAYSHGQQLLVELFMEGSQSDAHAEDNQVELPVQVTLAALPDLHVQALSCPEEPKAGETIALTYRVENIGSGETRVAKWMDAVYLTKDLYLTSQRPVVQQTVERTLAPGDSYEQTVQVEIPEDYTGNYNLFVEVNADAALFEGEQDANNVLQQMVTIMTPTVVPCDLTVESVQGPATYQVGETATLQWTIRNNEVKAVSGILKDAIYLSTDDRWDVSDVLIGTVSGSVALQPGETVNRTAHGVIRGVLPGRYYLLVRTNQMNQVQESDYANNVAASATTCQVDFQSLGMGSSVTVDGEGYYRLAAEAGETLQLHLEADGTEKGFQLYLSHDKPVSVTQYEYISAQPNDPYQEILVPEMKAGTYYILAQEQSQIASVENSFTLGEPVAAGEKKQMTLRAQLIQFGITRIDKAEGGNVGSVTSQVEGAKFDSIMDYRLKQHGKLLPAEAVYFQNSSQSYVTFRLDEMPTGTYDVEMEKVGGLRKELKSGYTVVQGNSGKLQTRFITTGAVRRGTLIPVVLEYANEGTSDVVASELWVVSLNDYPIGLTAKNISADNLKELHLPLREEGSNQPRSIAPGEKGSFTFYVRAKEVGTISLQAFVIE